MSKDSTVAWKGYVPEGIEENLHRKIRVKLEYEPKVRGLEQNIQGCVRGEAYQRLGQCVFSLLSYVADFLRERMKQGNIVRSY